MTLTINGCPETLWSGILSSGIFFRSLNKREENHIHTYIHTRGLGLGLGTQQQ